MMELNKNRIVLSEVASRVLYGVMEESLPLWMDCPSKILNILIIKTLMMLYVMPISSLLGLRNPQPAWWVPIKSSVRVRASSGVRRMFKTSSEENPSGLGKGVKASRLVALTALAAVILVFISIVNPATYHSLQILFAVIYTIVCLIGGSFGYATLVLIVAGTLHSFISPLSFLIVPIWVVRGSTTDVAFKLLKVYERPDPSTARVVIGMGVSSVITGITFYFLYVELLKAVPRFPPMIVVFILLYALAQTLVGTYIGVRLYRRVKVVLRG
jgi:hypothetical protein